MAGYYNFSMSNNAVDAYNSGEKPLSKWTKAEIIAAIKADYCEDDLKCTFSQLEALPAAILKKVCLKRSSWHHTSKHYNCTDFYSLHDFAICELDDKDITKLIAEYKKDLAEKKQQKEEQKEERWVCEFIVWEGTRNYPKARKYTEEGIIRGNWFYRSDGSKKSINANGFVMLHRVGEEPKARKDEIAVSDSTQPRKKTYKSFAKERIGFANANSHDDYYSIVFKSISGNDSEEAIVNFSRGGFVEAYIVTEKDVEIGEHYRLVATFKGNMMIMDTDGFVYFNREAEEFRIYRAGGLGCIIHMINRQKGEDPK